MALIKTTSDNLNNITFSKTESTLVYLTDTQETVFNGVNVETDVPKRGDIMCYNKNGEIKFIDANTINTSTYTTLKEKDYTTIGICIKTKGDNVLVAYKESTFINWKAPIERITLSCDALDNYFVITGSGSRPLTQIEYQLTYTNNGSFPLPVTTLKSYGTYNSALVNDTLKAKSRLHCVNQMNNYHNTNHLNGTPSVNRPALKFSAEVASNIFYAPVMSYEMFDDTMFYNDKTSIVLNTEYTTSGGTPVWHTNNLYVHCYFYEPSITYTTGSTPDCNYAKYPQTGSIIPVRGTNIFQNNGWVRDRGVINRSRAYDLVHSANLTLSVAATDISFIREGGIVSYYPVSEKNFNTSNYCQLFRDNFVDYKDYFESMMIKNPHTIGLIASETSGKENTKKLAKYKYLDFDFTSSVPLYPAAYYTNNINVPITGLSKGNWYLPSVAELAEINDGLNFSTSYWAENGELDIINKTIITLRQGKVYDGNGTVIDTYNGWSLIMPEKYMWSSSLYSENTPYLYNSNTGGITTFDTAYQDYCAIPIISYKYR